MKLIPIIKIKNRKIQNTSLEELIEFSNKNSGEKNLYILDYDGNKENKPNLCTYQKLNNHFEIIADNGPSNLGDIVDSYMTGVKAIVIRKKYYKNFNPEKVKYISENNVYLKIEYGENELDYDLFKGKLDGYITFLDKDKLELDFKYKSLLKQIIKELYCYENDKKNLSYWQKKEIKGILVDFDNYLEFENGISS